jgi:hypothetical protein
MSRRETELVAQHLVWRIKADARPEAPMEARPPAPLPSRDERLAAARARRAERLGQRPAPHIRAKPGAKVQTKAIKTTDPIKVRALPKVGPPAKRKKGAKRKTQRQESWTTRNTYGNTVIRPWRRNNSGGYSQS